MINLNEIFYTGICIFIPFLVFYLIAVLIGMPICMFRNLKCTVKNVLLIGPSYSISLGILVISFIFILGVLGKLLLMFLSCI